MPTISELIARQHAAGITYRQMADRAKAAGYQLTHQQINELENVPPDQWPKSAQRIRAYAAALDVSERAIVLAFARSFDLDVSERSSLLEVLLPVGTRDIDEGLQAAIAGVVRAAVKARHEGGGTSGDTAPIEAEVLQDDSVTQSVQAKPVRSPAKRGSRPAPT
ncbi:hypothetical protein ACPPVT_07705 [Angustibacter sp. McL0619]|uniref:hypothetical protein n=1 Tax=Angustibacter sp. McL0619 TaxID=3415676 RepID=UPI003CF08113